MGGRGASSTKAEGRNMKFTKKAKEQLKEEIKNIDNRIKRIEFSKSSDYLVARIRMTGADMRDKSVTETTKKVNAKMEEMAQKLIGKEKRSIVKWDITSMDW